MPFHTQTTLPSTGTSIERRSKKLSWTQTRSALSAEGLAVWPSPAGAHESRATPRAASRGTANRTRKALPRYDGPLHAKVLVDGADVAVGPPLLEAAGEPALRART